MAFDFLAVTMPQRRHFNAILSALSCALLRRVPFPVMSRHVVADLFSCLQLFIFIVPVTYSIIEALLANVTEYPSKHYHAKVDGPQGHYARTMMEERRLP